MSLLVYKDSAAGNELLGQFEFNGNEPASFTYNSVYLSKASDESLGVSERLPLRKEPYKPSDFSAFFQGLLPEGETLGALVQLYQVARNDYLHLIERLGYESIGALTFIADDTNPDEYKPSYEQLTPELGNSLIANPVRAVVERTSSTRLSLAGAQSKLAWFLPQNKQASTAKLTDWFEPFGTAPSTHIIKISRKGEEDIALNELACSLLSKACGIETAEVNLIPEIPGAIAVTRYDRKWVGNESTAKVLRLHQEDFCQALGFSSFFKYQPEHTNASYPAYCAELINFASEIPQMDRTEYFKRILFNYAIGNSDAHLKNFSLLYNESWTGRKLAPLYDATCIPLTGYSTQMPFNFGTHRELAEIDEDDILRVARQVRIGEDDFNRIIHEIVAGLEPSAFKENDSEITHMLDHILDNAQPRLTIIKQLL